MSSNEDDRDFSQPQRCLSQRYPLVYHGTGSEVSHISLTRGSRPVSISAWCGRTNDGRQTTLCPTYSTTNRIRLI